MSSEFDNKSEVLTSVEFAVIKEYMEAGGTDDGIAKVCGISRALVRKVREAPHYKQYMQDLKKIHRQRISEDPLPANSPIQTDEIGDVEKIIRLIEQFNIDNPSWHMSFGLSLKADTAVNDLELKDSDGGSDVQ